MREDYLLHLVARTAVHVGAAGTDPLADLALATDGQGRLYVPGTSWAGVLRAVARGLFDSGTVDELFGHQADDGEGAASNLTVSDTVVSQDVPVELRSGVGIDRRRGAAAYRIRYDRLVLPAGTEFGLRLRYEGPGRAELRRLVEVVRGGGLRLGAASSRGLGRLECTTAQVTQVDLTSRASVLALLAGDTRPLPVEPAGDVPGDLVRVRLAWRTRRPVVVAAAAPTGTADLAPLLTRGAGGLVPVLPGASVKGVLRSATERVLRTLLDTDTPSDDFVAELDRFADRVPAFEAVYGSRRRAGAVRVADTTATVDPIPGPDELGSAPWSRERTHVAIDRWTGGAADARLFTVDETQAVQWSDIEIELELRRLPTEHRVPGLLLLGVAIGQLVDGDIGFGHGLTRGLGEVEIAGVTVTVPPDLPPYRTEAGWWGWLRELSQGRDLLETLSAGGGRA